MNINNKIKKVKEILTDKKVAIGFSGGADSTLIAYLSSKVSKDTLAITINNHLMPKEFINHTKNMTDSFKIKHEIVDINFYNNKEFLLNNAKRCYNCRKEMYKHIKKIAVNNGYDFICDGNNISDLVIDRPGILITYDMNFKIPLIEAKLSSKEIHQYLHENNIPYSKSTTCLATRIPTNTIINEKKIKKIKQAENYIQDNTNCKIIKVRDINNHAICEVDNLDEILNNNKYIQINNQLKDYGFEKVALNLSALNDDEYISIKYQNNSFSYQLPFEINLKNTAKQLKISDANGKIELDNIIIYENGIIEGNNFETYEHAMNKFMEILPKIRRNV